MKKLFYFLKNLGVLILSIVGLDACIYVLKTASSIIRAHLGDSRILSTCYAVCLFAIAIPLIEKCLRTILEVIVRGVTYIRLRLEGVEIDEEELNLDDIPPSWMIKASCKEEIENLYEKYKNNTSGMNEEFNKGYVEGLKDVMSSAGIKYNTQLSSVKKGDEEIPHEKIEITGPEDGLQYYVL